MRPKDKIISSGILCLSSISIVSRYITIKNSLFMLFLKRQGRLRQFRANFPQPPNRGVRPIKADLNAVFVVFSQQM